MKKAYESYKKDFEEKVGPQKRELEELQASKAATCSTAKPAVGEQAYTVYGKYPANYSEYVASRYGMATMEKFYQYYQGSPTQE